MESHPWALQRRQHQATFLLGSRHGGFCQFSYPTHHLSSPGQREEDWLQLGFTSRENLMCCLWPSTRDSIKSPSPSLPTWSLPVCEVGHLGRICSDSASPGCWSVPFAGQEHSALTSAWSPPRAHTCHTSQSPMRYHHTLQVLCVDLLTLDPPDPAVWVTHTPTSHFSPGLSPFHLASN